MNRETALDSILVGMTAVGCSLFFMLFEHFDPGHIVYVAAGGAVGGLIIFLAGAISIMSD